MKPLPLSYIKSSGEYNWVNNPFTEFVTSSVDKNSTLTESQKRNASEISKAIYHKKKKARANEKESTDIKP